MSSYVPEEIRATITSKTCLAKNYLVFLIYNDLSFRYLVEREQCRKLD